MTMLTDKPDYNGFREAGFLVPSYLDQIMNMFETIHMDFIMEIFAFYFGVCLMHYSYVFIVFGSIKVFTPQWFDLLVNILSGVYMGLLTCGRAKCD